LPFVRPVIDDPTLLDRKFFTHKIGCLGIVFFLVGRAENGFKIHKLSPEKLSRAGNGSHPAAVSAFRPAILRINKTMSSFRKY
jgi:hypothetical protein